jgi:hypothetical protein
MGQMDRRLVVRLTAVAMILVLVAGAGGRGADAQGEPAVRLDLAAMALDGNDLPGDALLYVEQYLTPGQLAGLTGGAVPREELADAGLRWFYESRYVVPTEDEADIRLVYRSYVEEFREAAGAEAGFALLEDEARYGLADLADEAAPEIGEEPREVTTGSVPAVLPEGTNPRALYDLTFRVENVLAGVSVEAVDPADIDPALIEGLAGRLQERVEAVLAGEAIPGIDPALREGLLPLEARLSIQEGYQTADEGLLTTTDPGTGIFDGYQSGYAVTTALNLETDGAETPAPYVTLALSRFDSTDGPLDLLDSAAELQTDLPDIEEVPDIAVEGADGTAAFRFSSPASTTTDRDSFRILFAIGDQLAAVDVQAATSVDAAQAAAQALASQQIACLQAGGQCPTVELPAELL